MSKFSELLSRLCPDGAVFQALEELVQFEQPTKYLVDSTDYNDDYATPVLTAGQTFVLGHTDETSGIFPATQTTPVVIFDDFTTAFKWVDFPFKAKSSAMKMLTLRDPEVADLKYIYYAMQTINYAPQDHARQWISTYSRFRVPLPPLEVQREIVHILDQFIGLERELELELKARRRQFEHYSHVLMSSAEGARRVRLGDVAVIVRGASPRPIQAFITSEDNGVPWIKIGDVPTRGKYIHSTKQRVTPAGAAKSRRVRPGDFVLSNSMSFGRPYISKIDGYIHDGWLAISNFEESFTSDYLYYLLRSSPVQAEFARRAGSGTVRNLNADIVKAVAVPLPSRAEQNRVVALLDQFDSLVNDQDNGIPAELVARRKQYEHYRNRLLAFEEKTT